MSVGDQLVDINGTSTEEMTHGQAIALIRDHPRVRLLLKRNGGD
jgi:C-terminal processing protease CtpA/Prc